ncbi:nucleotidyl transferase AbiEii/AbiGii toxin family protein [Vibrio rotiferianus]|uniref:nucleotidyl transferase AbiEii/AbiGii toxin family protein n=1 Tax=Vibrio rotiferianus TaxID=190895 RepID=UPI00406A309E
MTNTYTLNNSLPLEFEKALAKVTQAVTPLKVPYFIAGATARDIVLHGVFGHPPIRATRDIDTALLVSSWDQFESIKQSLLSSGLKETEQAHRLKEPESGLPIDIIPFGDLADPKGQIQWPPSHDITMSVVGFKEAYDTAITIDFHGQYLKVASLPGITMLKLMAWDERGDESNKDATDFYTVLSKYELIHDGRLWEDYVPSEEFDYDVKKQAAFLLGFDLKDLLSEATRAILIRIKEEKRDALISAITRTHKSAEVDEVEGQLEAFWMGVGI